MQSYDNDYHALIRISEIVSFAEFLTTDIVSIRNTEPVYPVTIGEQITCYTLDLVLLHEWSSGESESVIQPLEDALNQLDTGVDKPETWGDLFIANTALKSYLKQRID